MADVNFELPQRDIIVRYGLQLFCKENGISFFPYDGRDYSDIEWKEDVPLPAEDELYAKGKTALEAIFAEMQAAQEQDTAQ